MSTNFVLQSTSQETAQPFHVAVIMDGNGRWAARRGLPRPAGHRAGARVVRRAVEAAPSLGITTLTLYALSSDNFRRPAAEVASLLRLFAEYLERERDALAGQGVRLTVIGRRDRLPNALRRAVERAEATTAEATAGGAKLSLRLAIDYSARHEILSALSALTRQLTAEDAEGRSGTTYDDVLVSSASSVSSAVQSQSPFAAWPDVDLLVRTGGEQRLSDFLLWECAYAELWFTDRLWPDMTERDLAAAVADFRRRDRRFGRISA